MKVYRRRKVQQHVRQIEASIADRKGDPKINRTIALNEWLGKAIRARVPRATRKAVEAYILDNE